MRMLKDLTLMVQAIHLQMCAVARLAALRKAVDKYYLVGVTGLQSGGKSTLTERLIGKQVIANAMIKPVN